MHRLLGDPVGLALANHPLGDRVHDAVTYARYSVGPSLGAYPAMFRFYPGYLLARRRMTRFLGAIIEDHRAHPPSSDRPADFIDGLLSGVDEEGRPLSPAAVFANAQMVYTNSILYGGPSAAFLLYVVLRDEGLRAALTAEIDEALASPVTPETLCRLPTVMKAVKESMRLHPVALATPRVVRESFEFEGYQIAKGESVLIAGSVCHLLDPVHPKAEQFDIERELGPSKNNTYVPFGSGVHQCPAGGLMEMVLAVSLVAVLRTVSLETNPGDYILRKVVNPFPEPSRDFRFRVTGTRP
jgi:cytochrome P450